MFAQVVSVALLLCVLPLVSLHAAVVNGAWDAGCHALSVSCCLEVTRFFRKRAATTCSGFADFPDFQQKSCRVSLADAEKLSLLPGRV